MFTLINYGTVKKRMNSSNTKILSYSQEIHHNGLDELKIISAIDKTTVKSKVKIQVNKWNEKWTEVQEKKRAEAEKDTNIKEAEERSKKAEKEVKDVENILLYTLDINNAINWSQLQTNNKFNANAPIKPMQHISKQYALLPNKDDEEFSPSFCILDYIFKWLKRKKIIKYETLYNNALSNWRNSKTEIDKENKNMDITYSYALQTWDNKIAKWNIKKHEFYNNQIVYNKNIEKFKDSYLKYDENAIFKYCEMVLNNSKYPLKYSKGFQIEYNPNSKILIVEYYLPAPKDIPNIKDIKYIISRKELKVNYLADSQAGKLYDSTIYKITLRTIHELFDADVINAISAISFNGWVSFLNKANGNMEDACIVSIQVMKDIFTKIDLRNVEPKTCFKSLKGVSSSNLIQITAMRPILKINKEDKRFIHSYDVTSSLDEKNNLASMDWGDFEHLIREIFEKEFSKNGGEVKVTRASRDGGVDAIAFDPDPIRGGKIVIQAKRYTNTVGVSDVRDLYGTVLNEGATKGVLVTTSDYGPDSYDFITNKPLTLMNGANLLYLLEKHGHHAMIDLNAAKRDLNIKID